MVIRFLLLRTELWSLKSEGGDKVPSYEVMYIVKPGLEEETYQGLIDRFNGVIQAQGGSVTSVDKWGIRKLAYDIQKHREGYYVVANFTGPSTCAQELDRVLKITDEVLRHMIVRTDK